MVTNLHPYPLVSPFHECAMAPPPRELDDDVVSEILLRLPPDEPECLFRAALVCKPWFRTISDPAFLRRYRAFHGTPPLLGIIDANLEVDGTWSSRLVPTRAVPAFPLPWPDTRLGFPRDCRHGRVLVQDRHKYFHVCDPVTGKDNLHHLPQPGITIGGITGHCSASAVFCAAFGCKHLDCHGGPFRVVLMVRDFIANTISATVYSSEIGAWSVPAALEYIRDHSQASGYGAVIGHEIYFMLSSRTGIIKYDWRKNCLSLVNLPPSAVNYDYWVTLMVMEDSSLGLAGTEHSNLYLWSRWVSSEGTAEWVQFRVIDLEILDTVMPMANPNDDASVVGFAEGLGLIFVRTCVGLFMIELKSERVRKIRRPNSFKCLPYMGFCTPDRFRLSR